MEDPKRITKVGSILVSQPKPSGDKSPYFGLAEKYNLKVDFRPFIQINPINVKEFRKQKINILGKCLNLDSYLWIPLNIH